jgi:hypothetical protein
MENTERGYDRFTALLRGIAFSLAPYRKDRKDRKNGGKWGKILAFPVV